MTDHIPQPLPICQQVYGVQNVNLIRDAVVNCYRRFLGSERLYEPHVYCSLQCTLSQLLLDAGRNPLAVKLAISPDRLQPNPFPFFLHESGGDREVAYQKAMQYLMDQPSGSDEEWKHNVLNVYIDYHSV